MHRFASSSAQTKPRALFLANQRQRSANELSWHVWVHWLFDGITVVVDSWTASNSPRGGGRSSLPSPRWAHNTSGSPGGPAFRSNPPGGRSLHAGASASRSPVNTDRAAQPRARSVLNTSRSAWCAWPLCCAVEEKVRDRVPQLALPLWDQLPTLPTHGGQWTAQPDQPNLLKFYPRFPGRMMVLLC